LFSLHLEHSCEPFAHPVIKIHIKTQNQGDD
jgi:hypothetical protein